MKAEYDFSIAERSKFFREGGRLVPRGVSADRHERWVRDAMDALGSRGERH
jgi:hypothetical protein